jgi:regulator of protease activity HflC (stomatin/prohibitin superfamily)
MEAGLILLVVIAVFVVITAAMTIRIVPQAKAGIVERLGRYSRTLDAGLTVIVPLIDRVKPLIDLREQVVSFPPQPVITEDNLVVQIDTVIYFQITEPKSVTYEVANPLQAIEQLTVTTLRNVIGGMTLEDTLTSRDQVNSQLRVVLDEATGKWGIRVNRVELKSVDPPTTIQQAMEKQMRAERDRRAAILNAEGVKQSQILTAEGEKQSAVLRAEGQRESAILRAQGEAQAIETVFGAIHEGKPDRALLSYQYLQMLPQLARGEANKIFVIPSEFSEALGRVGAAFGGDRGGEGTGSGAPGHGPGDGPSGSGDGGAGPPAGARPGGAESPPRLGEGAPAHPDAAPGNDPRSPHGSER